MGAWTSAPAEVTDKDVQAQASADDAKATLSSACPPEYAEKTTVLSDVVSETKSPCGTSSSRACATVASAEVASPPSGTEVVAVGDLAEEGAVIASTLEAAIRNELGTDPSADVRAAEPSADMTSQAISSSAPRVLEVKETKKSNAERDQGWLSAAIGAAIGGEDCKDNNKAVDAGFGDSLHSEDDGVANWMSAAFGAAAADAGVAVGGDAGSVATRRAPCGAADAADGAAAPHEPAGSDAVEEDGDPPNEPYQHPALKELLEELGPGICCAPNAEGYAEPRALSGLHKESNFPEQVGEALARRYTPAELFAIVDGQAEWEVSRALNVDISDVRRYGKVRDQLQILRVNVARARITNAFTIGSDATELRLAIAAAQQTRMSCDDPDLRKATEALAAIDAEHRRRSSGGNPTGVRAAPVDAQGNPEAAEACAAITRAAESGDASQLAAAIKAAKALGVPKKDIAKANAAASK